MKVIAIISQKGGTGKTTLAVHLAVSAELHGKTSVVIDLDPQGSAIGWKDSRNSDTPDVVSCQAARLPNVLKAAESGADLVFIDTAPHSESTALVAARHSDLVLIPCRPAILDLRAIGSTVDIVGLAKTNAVAVLNSVPPRGSLGKEAEAAIKKDYELEVAPVHICQRVAYVHALTAGQVAQEYEPEGKAAKEINKLYMFACKHVGV